RRFQRRGRLLVADFAERARGGGGGLAVVGGERLQERRQRRRRLQASQLGDGGETHLAVAVGDGLGQRRCRAIVDDAAERARRLAAHRRLGIGPQRRPVHTP